MEKNIEKVKNEKKIVLIQEIRVNFELSLKFIFYDLKNEKFREFVLDDLKLGSVRIFRDKNIFFILNTDFDNQDIKSIYCYNSNNNEVLEMGGLETASLDIQLIFKYNNKVKMLLSNFKQKELLIYENLNKEWIKTDKIKIKTFFYFYYWFKDSLLGLNDFKKIIFNNDKILTPEIQTGESDDCLNSLDKCTIYDFFEPSFCLCSNFISRENINLLDLNTSEILFLFGLQSNNNYHSLFLACHEFNGKIIALDNKSRIYHYDLKQKKLLKVVEEKMNLKNLVIIVKKMPYLNREFNYTSENYDQNQNMKNIKNSIFECGIKEPGLIEYKENGNFQRHPLKFNRHFYNPQKFILDDFIMTRCTHRINKNLLFVIRSNYGFLLIDIISKTIIKTLKIDRIGSTKSVRIKNRIYVQKENSISYQKAAKKILVLDLDNWVLLEDITYRENLIFFCIYNDLLLMNKFGEFFVYNLKIKEWEKIMESLLKHKFNILSYLNLYLENG